MQDWGVSTDDISLFFIEEEERRAKVFEAFQDGEMLTDCPSCGKPLVLQASPTFLEYCCQLCGFYGEHEL